LAVRGTPSYDGDDASFSVDYAIDGDYEAGVPLYISEIVDYPWVEVCHSMKI